MKGTEADALGTYSAWILSRRRTLSKESAILKVPVEEVYAATNNLHESNFIGQGTAGVFSGNQQVAIKHNTNEGCAETFVREVGSLAHIRHPNLVALLGYCESEGECFLIYELCPNGNLSEWLYGKDNVLSWIQRLQIAIGSARGLWVVHAYPGGCIVHRDVKTSNILLGANFEAKLSEFGLSKVMNSDGSYASSEARGTFGYVDPEYQSNRLVSAAGDIYRFGVVLLQILSGRRVINMNMKKPMSLDKIVITIPCVFSFFLVWNNNSNNSSFIVEQAKSLTKYGSTAEFADPKLHGEYSVEALKLKFELALSRMALKQKRPSIGQIIVKLEEALDISTRTKASSPDWSLVP
ncbi:unnamed protein product [Fraxinus pennsylvanica]|uniref:Protein kinase domain-containing protein n=1 Tax=Fraxinus pennsylvanica TaxID=56036 RepID=A0AAD1YK16_9LAMI|nr:unnamed protein product [Fraxinus pennsylvanica]